MLLAAAAVPQSRAATPTHISPIGAVFVPSKLATRYSVTLVGTPPPQVTYTWTLTLALVDPAGSPSPASPDSHAAVDPTCDDAELPGGTRAGDDRFTWTNQSDSFLWFHGDKGSYGDSYGCDHAKMGPSGHQGIVAVVVRGDGWTCSARIEGSNLSPQPEQGPAPSCVEQTETTTATPPTSPPIERASSSGGGFPIWIPIVVVLALLAGGGAWYARPRGGADDCAELRKRCTELRAEANRAAERAKAADAEAKRAQTELDKAKSAREHAQQAATAADHPDEGESYVEDADTGERITEHDLQLEREAGGSDWGDPAARRQRRLDEQAKAHAGLDSATQAEASAQAAADAAAKRAADADAAAARAEADADAACAAADECERTAAAAKKAAEDEAARQAAAAEQQRQAAEAARQVEEAKPQEPQPTVATAPAPQGAPRPQAHRPECEDGCDPETTTTYEELDLYVMSLADVEIDGAYQFSAADVAAAMAGFETFKLVVDLADVVEGIPEAAADAVHEGAAAADFVVDTTLRLIGAGYDTAGTTNWVDPGSMIDDAVKDGLEKLIEQVNAKRALGTWQMKVPLMRMRATCTTTKECRDGRWVVTRHQFELSVVGKVRDHTESADNWDYDNPGRGAAEVSRRLHHAYEILNRDATARLKRLVQSCASGY